MPDLVTHGALAFLIKGLSRGGSVPVFVLGSILPDLASHVPAAALMVVDRRLFDLPSLLIYAWYPLHLPLGVLLVCYLTALLFPQETRPRAFRELLLGSLIHLFLDLLQAHTGTGYMLFYPFLTADFEIGVMGSETSTMFAPLLIVLTSAVWRWRRGRWNFLKPDPEKSEAWGEP